MRRSALFRMALFIGVWAGACSSGGEDSAKPCTAICDCVAKTAGEASRQQCATECAQTTSASDCESRLSANGLSQCTSYCSGFSKSSGGGIPCTQSGPDGNDSDCTAVGKPRKFDCTSASAQSTGLAAGCVKEHPDDPTDYDVCCPTSVTGSTSNGSSATLSDFCAKCATCLATSPGFSEGFCTPFASGSSFDQVTCAANGDVSQLDMPNVDRSVLMGWSCDTFDNSE